MGAVTISEGDGRGARARAVLRRLGGLRGWDAAVAASGLVVLLAGIALGVGWLVTVRSDAVSYSVRAPVAAVELSIWSGSVTIRGGTSDNVRVRRLERSAFERRPRERRSLAGRMLRVSSRCPRIVVGRCSVAYGVTVPDDVTVTVRTGRGDVRVAGFHGSARIHTGSGDVTVDAFCGFGLSVSTGSGAIRAIAACAPKRLDLRSVSGAATAVVPPGRYRIRAASDTGRRRVTGVLPTAGAPFAIDVRSHSGAVTVTGGL